MKKKAKSKSKSKSKKPLRREDLHRHPTQGTQPFRGPSPHHDPAGHAWQPFAAIPGIMHPHAAGVSGFTTGNTGAAGRYFGVGPRNYARADERVLEDVCELLTRHGELDVRDVDVHCRNGVIRLEGSVPTKWMRREIEAAAECITGVVDVENHLGIEAGRD